MKYFFLIITFFTVIQCKTSMEKANIQSIDSEFNQRSEFNFKYFEISDYSNLTDEDLTNQLKSFADLSQQSSTGNKEVTCFFYRKKTVGGYADEIRRAAEENEFGGIEGSEKDLVAKIRYRNSGTEKLQDILIYKNNKMTKKTEFKN